MRNNARVNKEKDEKITWKIRYKIYGEDAGAGMYYIGQEWCHREGKLPECIAHLQTSTNVFVYACHT